MKFWNVQGKTRFVTTFFFSHIPITVLANRKPKIQNTTIRKHFAHGNDVKPPLKIIFLLEVRHETNAAFLYRLEYSGGMSTLEKHGMFSFAQMLC